MKKVELFTMKDKTGYEIFLVKKACLVKLGYGETLKKAREIAKKSSIYAEEMKNIG